MALIDALDRTSKAESSANTEQREAKAMEIRKILAQRHQAALQTKPPSADAKQQSARFDADYKQLAKRKVDDKLGTTRMTNATEAITKSNKPLLLAYLGPNIHHATHRYQQTKSQCQWQWQTTQQELTYYEQARTWVVCYAQKMLNDALVDALPATGDQKAFKDLYASIRNLSLSGYLKQIAEEPLQSQLAQLRATSEATKLSADYRSAARELQPSILNNLRPILIEKIKAEMARTLTSQVAATTVLAIGSLQALSGAEHKQVKTDHKRGHEDEKHRPTHHQQLIATEKQESQLTIYKQHLLDKGFAIKGKSELDQWLTKLTVLANECNDIAELLMMLDQRIAEQQQQCKVYQAQHEQALIEYKSEIKLAEQDFEKTLKQLPTTAKKPTVIADEKTHLASNASAPVLDIKAIELVVDQGDLDAANLQELMQTAAQNYVEKRQEHRQKSEDTTAKDEFLTAEAIIQVLLARGASLPVDKPYEWSWAILKSALEHMTANNSPAAAEIRTLLLKYCTDSAEQVSTFYFSWVYRPDLKELRRAQVQTLVQLLQSSTVEDDKLITQLQTHLQDFNAQRKQQTGKGGSSALFKALETVQTELQQGRLVAALQDSKTIINPKLYGPQEVALLDRPKP